MAGKKRTRYEFSGDEGKDILKCKECVHQYTKIGESDTLYCSAKGGCKFKTRKSIHSKACDWNSGFMFMEGFMTSKRFERYRKKVSEAASDFLREACNYKQYGLLDDMIYDFMDNLMNPYNDCDYLPKDSVDWRFNLQPFGEYKPWCMLHGLESRSDGQKLPLKFFMTLMFNEQRAKKGGVLLQTDDHDKYIRELKDSLYRSSLEDACLQYLHICLIRGGDVSEENFMAKAVPSTPEECMIFVKILLNIFYTEALLYAVQSFANHSTENLMMIRRAGLDGEDPVRKLDNFLKKCDDLTASLEAAKKETEKQKEQNAALKDEIASLRGGMSQDISKQVTQERAKLYDELKQLRKDKEEAEKEAARYKELLDEAAERIAILEEVDEEVSSGGEEAPVDLNYDSRIVFVVSRAKNSSVENTLNRVAAMFPNSSYLYKPDDIRSANDADCYVMLTKYIQHHSVYNAAKNRCKALGIPCIHSASQNPEKIASDILNRVRYNGSVS